jgi:hypothetical protein
VDYDFSNDDYSAWEYDEYMATKDVGSEQYLSPLTGTGSAASLDKVFDPPTNILKRRSLCVVQGADQRIWNPLR